MKLKALLFAGLLVAGMSIGLVACGQANKASVSASNSGSSATQGTSSSEAIRIGVPDDGTNLSRGIKFTALPFNAPACGVLRDWRGTILDFFFTGRVQGGGPRQEASNLRAPLQM